MKVLLINGSPRARGNTRIALEEMARTLEAEGIDTEIVWIGTKPVRGCIACGKCKELGRCVFDDDSCNTIAEKCEGTDGFVFGSPVYYGQPNGALLAIQQRLLYSSGGKLQGKPAAAVCICRRGGGTAAFQTLQMPFQMCNMPLVGSQYWGLVYGREPGQAAFDEEGMQTMRHLARNMAHLLRSLQATHPAPAFDEPWAGTHFVREDLMD
jgi:Multimeric flavodoxin WrbA